MSKEAGRGRGGTRLAEARLQPQGGVGAGHGAGRTDPTALRRRKARDYGIEPRFQRGIRRSFVLRSSSIADAESL
jgi:hypothetical protein